MINNVCYFERKLTTVCVTILKLDKLTNILRVFFSINNYHTNDLLYYFDETNNVLMHCQ